MGKRARRARTRRSAWVVWLTPRVSHALNAACADDGLTGAVPAEDDAEWMASGVGEDPEVSLRSAWRTSGAKRE